METAVGCGRSQPLHCVWYLCIMSLSYLAVTIEILQKHYRMKAADAVTVSFLRSCHGCVPALNTGHIILFTLKTAWNINVCSFLEQNFMYDVCIFCTPLYILCCKSLCPPSPQKTKWDLSEKNKSFGLSFPTWFDQRFQL